MSSDSRNVGQHCVSAANRQQASGEDPSLVQSMFKARFGTLPEAFDRGMFWDSFKALES